MNFGTQSKRGKEQYTEASMIGIEQGLRLRKHNLCHTCKSITILFVLQIVYSILASDGYHQSESPTQADIVLLNTCSIREKAEGKIFSRLGSLRSSRAQAHQPETQVQSQTIFQMLP